MRKPRRPPQEEPATETGTFESPECEETQIRYQDKLPPGKPGLIKHPRRPLPPLSEGEPRK